MKMLNLILMSLVMIVSSGYCLADTLYLRNGNVIQSDTIWQDDGYFMYKKYGATVGVAEGKVDRVEYSSQSEDTGSSLQFDVWPFGCTVHEAINIAENNDIPLHKFGIISMNKRFHPMVKKHSDATHFYYNTNLLGHFATVALFFTPVSKQLHTVQIKWPNQPIKDSRLISEIVSTVSNKYGEYQNTSFGARKWLVGDKNQITEKASFNRVFLNYLHMELIQKAKLETEHMKTQKIQTGAIKDKSKF